MASIDYQGAREELKRIFLKDVLLQFVNRILPRFLLGVCKCGHPYFYA